MHNWVIRNGLEAKILQSVDDFPHGCIGFIYKITNLEDGRFYIGRKQLQSKQSKKLTKKEIAEVKGKGRKPTKKIVVKESNWADYYGSCIPLLEDIKKLGKGTFKREILKFCFTKKQLTYYELRFQIYNSVLEKPTHTYNRNIQGKYFPEDLLNP
jgi:hypothetical protein